MTRELQYLGKQSCLSQLLQFLRQNYHGFGSVSGDAAKNTGKPTKSWVHYSVGSVVSWHSELPLGLLDDMSTKKIGNGRRDSRDGSTADQDSKSNKHNQIFFLSNLSDIMATILNMSASKARYNKFVWYEPWMPISSFQSNGNGPNGVITTNYLFLSCVSNTDMKPYLIGLTYWTQLTALAIVDKLTTSPPNSITGIITIGSMAMAVWWLLKTRPQVIPK